MLNIYIVDRVFLNEKHRQATIGVPLSINEQLGICLHLAVTVKGVGGINLSLRPKLPEDSLSVSSAKWL